MPAAKHSRLTQSYLRKLLHYDQRSGVFTWLVDRGGRYARRGQPAGNRRKSGHLVIGIEGKIYSAARLAWLYVHGEFPPCNVVFKDKDPTNLAFANLTTVLETNKRTYKAVYNRNYYRARRNMLLYGNPRATPNRFETPPDDGPKEPAARRGALQIWGNWDGYAETMFMSSEEQFEDLARRRRARQRKPRPEA